MATAELSKPIDAATVERVLLHGDLKQLTPAQKISYYHAVCESVGLNPLTQPLKYLVLNGKEVLYALRDATDQLRKIHRVSITIMAREVTEDCYVVTARASLPDGRQDENIGAVPIATLKGEARANAMMKAETKAKRRVTLAICGLGMLDETEVESIPDARLVVEAPAGPVAAIPPAPNGDPARTPSVPNGGELGRSRPAGAVLVRRVSTGHGKAKGFVELDPSSVPAGKGYAVYDERLKTLAEELCQNGEYVTPTFKTAASGQDYLIGLARATFKVEPADQPEPPPLTDDDLAF